MKPQTQPTDKELLAMFAELQRLLNTFGSQQVADLLDVSPVTIRAWMHRGRISAVKAHQLCKHPAISELGFTRESLRPDVKVWTIGQ